MAGTRSGGAPPAGGAAESAGGRGLIPDLSGMSLEQFAFEFGTRILGVLAILVVALVLGRWLRRAITRSLERAKFDLTLSRFAGNAARYLLLVVAVLACLEVFGVRMTSLVAMLGAAGLGVGLALQGSLSNLAAGVALLVFRPFRVGDFVAVAGQMGVVNEIELFTTTLDTFDNKRIFIPNGAIFGTVIENFTHHPTRGVEVDVGVSYAADLDATRRTLEGALRRVPDVAPDPPAQVILWSLGDSAVMWKLRAWVPRDRFLDARQAMVHAIKTALDAAGIEIPFPQRVVTLRGGVSSPPPAA